MSGPVDSGIALKPCPVCGSTNIDPEGWKSMLSVGPACDDCNGSAETVELWNTRPSETAAEKRVSELEMQSRGNWLDAEQLAAVIRHAVWEADNQAGVIDVDKLRAALEKSNG